MSETAEANALDAPVKASNLGREVAVVDRGGAVVALPQNLAQQIEFAQLMARGGPMVGKPFRNNPGACLGIATQAWRWGQDPYSCSQKAYLVGDTIGYEAQLIHAIILTNAPLTRRPKFEYSGEGPTRRCKVSFFVKGEPEPLEYESPQFKDIKTKNSPLWVADPDQQFGYYSVRAGARRHFPDIIMGLYTPDELREDPRAIAEAGAAITLSGDVEGAEAGADIPDAEFTPIDTVMAKAAEKSGKKKAAQKAAKAEGNAGEKSAVTATEPKPGDRPAESPTSATQATADGEKTAQTGRDPDEPEEESDEQLVSRIEAEVKAAKGVARSQPIRENKGALRAIVETSEDEALKARANKLLNLFDLDD